MITKVVRDRKIQPRHHRQGVPGPGRARPTSSPFYVQSGKLPGRFVTLTKAKK